MIKCLFVRAPFAGWIVDGVKFTEFRTRPTSIRGRIGIIESGTGTVIGDVELCNCRKSLTRGYYEWSFRSHRRYVRPIPFPSKPGAVVWINLYYNPNAPEIAPRLRLDALLEAGEAYQKELKKFFDEQRERIMNGEIW